MMITQLERFIYELKTFSQVPIDRDELIHTLDMVHAELLSVEDKEREQEERYDQLYDEYEELALDVSSLEDTICDLEEEIRELSESQEDE